MVKAREKGFTLLELLLVVFIIGILGALVVGRFVGVQKDVKIKAATAQIKQFSSNLERYKLDMDEYPTTEEGLQALVRRPDDEERAAKWKGPYLSEMTIPKDPWGKDYVYRCPGEHNELTFDIMSPGPDGEEGSEDDIVNWATEDF